MNREEHDRKHADYIRKHADYIVELACKAAPQDHIYLVFGIYSNWIEERDEMHQYAPGSGPSDVTRLDFGPFSLTHGKAVIRGLVGEGCPVAKELGERIIRRLNARVREIDERMMQVDSQ